MKKKQIKNETVEYKAGRRDFKNEVISAVRKSDIDTMLKNCIILMLQNFK